MLSSNTNFQFSEFVRNEETIDPTGKVILLGTASDGPVLSPTPVRDILYAETLFGSAETSELSRGAYQAFKSGADEVILMRISGKEATNIIYALTESEKVVIGLKLKSTFGGAKYNNVEVQIDEDKIIFSFESSKIIYKFEDYPTLGLLSDAINQDAKEGKNKVYTLVKHRKLESNSLKIINDRTINLYGGSDGLNLTKNDKYLQLEEAYSILNDYPVEIFVPLGVYVDDTYPYSYYGITKYNEGWYANPSNLDEDKWLTLVHDNGLPRNFGKQLIEFCATRQERGFRAIGIMGMKPSRETAAPLRDNEYSHINKLLTNPIIKNGFVGTSTNRVIQNKYLLSIVASEVNTSFGQFSYQENAAVSYAVLLGSLPPEVSPTNKSIHGVSLPYEFTREELDKLDSLNYVTLRQSIRRGIVPTNGTTIAKDDSGLKYITSVRIIQGLINEINLATEGLSGDPIETTGNYDLIKDTIEKILGRYKKNEMIKDYSSEMLVDKVNGEIIIMLNISLYYEVNKVHTSVRFNIN